MRLFVALPVPADVRAQLAEATSHARDHSPRALRWAPPERWHLTLAFLGDDVTEQVLPDLERRLARAASRHALGTLRLSGAGRFDGRVVWTGVAGDVEGLKALAAAVTAATRRAGLAVEDRPYRPHLTLARASTTTDLRPVVTALGGFAGPPWVPVALELVRSRLGPRPTYETLATFPLRRPSP